MVASKMHMRHTYHGETDWEKLFQSARRDERFHICRLCSGYLKDPRNLPCSHVFCKECLRLHIINTAREKGFFCPQCTEYITPPRPILPRMEWAGQFPCNLRVQRMIMEKYNPAQSIKVYSRIRENAGSETTRKPSEQSRKKSIGLPKTTDTYDTCCICLLGYRDPRELPCGHTLCKGCLQIVVSNTAVDLGFRCPYCEEFVCPPRPILPRAEWAEQFPNNSPAEKKGEKKRTKRDDGHFNLFIQWTGTLKRINKTRPQINGRVGLPNAYQMEDRTFRSENKEKPQRITAASFYEEGILIYDDEYGEVRIYDSELNQVSSVQRPNVYDITVLDKKLYMSNPQDRNIEVYDLQKRTELNPIKLTMRCFGIDSYDDQIVVLLCESGQGDHIAFMDMNGFRSDSVDLNQGKLKMKAPRHLSFSKHSKLVCVSDEEKGIVKAFHIHGRLVWEKKVQSPGHLAVRYQSFLVARKFTNSIDLLMMDGRKEGDVISTDHDIKCPEVVCTNSECNVILIVDSSTEANVFRVSHSNSNVGCSCAIL